MDDFGNMILEDYWCQKCCSWQMFQFEDRGMCDWCAISAALSKWRPSEREEE